MKATLDIPDDLYRQVKARSALEGRSLRSVAIQLFQTWLDAASTTGQPTTSMAADETSAPWLAVTRCYLQPDMNHDMEAVRAAIARGWAAESAEIPGPTHP
jgi:hypothetical protein